MFDTGLKVTGTLLFVTSLASCTTAGMFPKPGQAYVKEVAVTIDAAKNPPPPGLESRLHATLVSDAARAPQAGAPQRLSIAVKYYRLKNPAIALLLSDENTIFSTMTVTDLTTGAPSKPIDLRVQDAGNVNHSLVSGVVSAIQAATQDPTLVESRMINATSSKALEQFYGTKLLQTYWSAPRPATAPASTVPPAPAKPMKNHADKAKPAKTKPVAPAAAQPGA